ncbi:hypothetical protein NP493_857g00050 [Ridgeia piscesae]|uniref:Uncharacterized protein n=1 Tax=Ridgeia piscesae TaxID=27915 RepID=A0AAD9NKS6_RIDPI|nr:hypothetical protein NP493_857g00050 [Ridgeia piscesae]
MDGGKSLCAPAVYTFDLSEFSTSYRFPCGPRRMSLPSVDHCSMCSPHASRHPPPPPVPPLHGCCPCHRALAKEFVCGVVTALPEAPLIGDPGHLQTIRRNMGPGQYVPPSIPCPDGLARPSAYVYRPHAGPPTVPAPLQLDPPPDPCVPPGPRIHDYRVVMHAVDAYDERDLPQFDPPEPKVHTERPYWAPCQPCSWQPKPKYSCGPLLAQKPYPVCRPRACWSSRFPISCEDPPYKRAWDPPKSYI